MAKYIVRCGSMRTLHVLQARDRYVRGNRVIARTPRGLEFGEVLGEATQQSLDQMKDPPLGTIQRLATTQDENELKRIASMAKEEFKRCKEIIAQCNLPMDLVDIEHLLGGERVVVYYISEDRIDFRELVKNLANEFQTRIEMKQIGVRDEAKLLADYGDCGKPVCCNTHLFQMPPVSMKMAKMQKATLDPNKISGRCGRLKCCLRYEYDVYEENYRDLPPIGSDVVTNQGRARVLGHEILSKQVLLIMEDDRRLMLSADDILSVIRSGNSGNHQGNNDRSNDGRGTEEGRGASDSRGTQENGRRDRGRRDNPRTQESKAKGRGETFDEPKVADSQTLEVEAQNDVGINTNVDARDLSDNAKQEVTPIDESDKHNTESES